MFRRFALFFALSVSLVGFWGPSAHAVTLHQLRSKREAFHDARVALSRGAPTVRYPVGFGEHVVSRDPRTAAHPRLMLARRFAMLGHQLRLLVGHYREQQAMQRLANRIGHPLLPEGTLRTCPVAGPTTFSDDFGAPRPGGRTHEGIDLSGPTGRPVVAVLDGVVTRSTSLLGGLGIHLTAPDGTDMYYAHLSAYEASGAVEAGTIIGRVGSTGDATGPHLHFEYHPEGGSAVDPYRFLREVC